MNDNDQINNDSFLDVTEDQLNNEPTPDTLQEPHIVTELQPPKLPDQLYLTALNDTGEERSSKKSFSQKNAENQDPNQQTQPDGDGNIFSQYSQEEIDNFRCIFEMFDKTKSGFIEVNDLQTIMRSLGRDPHEAIELLQGLDLNTDVKISFEDFLRLMKTLENRLVTGKDEDEKSPREADIEERNKYGCLLPRTGVHFLPDSKVVDFLKLLNDYRKKCCKEMNLSEAIRAQLKFDDLRGKEILRQMQNMRQAQEQELITVENAQRQQFLEFSQAWDNYMSDYEATAYLSLEKLKEKHILELQQNQEQIRREYKLKLKFSKELMEMRKQVLTLISLKRYEEAEALKNDCDAKEGEERKEMETQIDEQIQKSEERLRTKQQMALAALLKRIQRDRNEQLKHRQIDSQRLIQRNKNLLLDLLNKQNMETRRTNQFLRFALGVRSPDKKNYFKSKLFTAPEETKLKIGSRENSKTVYGNMHNQTNTSFIALKNQQMQESRAKTSKGKFPLAPFNLSLTYIIVGEQRGISMEMSKQPNNNNNDSMMIRSSKAAAQRLNVKKSSNMGNQSFMGNRGSINGNKSRDETLNTSNNIQASTNQVKLPMIKQ